MGLSIDHPTLSHFAAEVALESWRKTNCIPIQAFERLRKCRLVDCAVMAATRCFEDSRVYSISVRRPDQHENPVFTARIEVKTPNTMLRFLTLSINQVNGVMTSRLMPRLTSVQGIKVSICTPPAGLGIG